MLQILNTAVVMFGESV